MRQSHSKYRLSTRRCEVQPLQIDENHFWLNFELRRGVLFDECGGTLNVETDRRIDEDICQKFIRHSVRRVLIRIRQIQRRWSMLENFHAGACINRRMGHFPCRIAIVDQAEENYAKGDKFFKIGRSQSQRVREVLC